MDLHHSGDRPDWEEVPAARRNTWQHLAAATHGLVTPANTVSVAGFALAGAGIVLLASGAYLAGIGLLVIGRAADAFDGAIAQKTATKSPLGETIDAGLDKIIAFLALAVIVATGIMPWWLAGLIALQNAASIVLAWYGSRRAITVQPSRNGKWATAGYWAGIALFVSLQLSFVPATPVRVLSYVVTLFALLLGADTTYGYFQTARGKILPVTASKTAFRRIIVLKNPLSSEAHKAQARIELLRKLMPQCNVTVLQAPVAQGEDKTRVLRDNQQLLGPQTLFCIAAGDGTVNMLLGSLLHDPDLSADARRTVILPLWCGNANDLAYMLNGRWSRRRLRRILRYGQVVQIKPLACTLRSLQGVTIRHTAASYASFGATAYVTRELERVLPRRSARRRFGATRLGQEILAVLRALAQAPTFTLTEHGQMRVMYERTYLNGSRFAKVFGIPFRLTDEKFHRHTIEKKHVIALLLSIIGLMNGREISKKAITHDRFTVHDTVWAQFDGEPVKLAPGTEVEMAVSDQPFYALSLRLR